MTPGWLAAFEVGLVDGSVLLLCGWEPMRLRRALRPSADRPAANVAPEPPVGHGAAPWPADSEASGRAGC